MTLNEKNQNDIFDNDLLSEIGSTSLSIRVEIKAFEVFICNL